MKSKSFVPQKIVLATLADAKFVNQAKQLFASVYFKAGWSGDYLLLAQGIGEADLDWFRQKGIIIFNCLPLSDEPIGAKQYPAIVLSKFYLFTEYFKRWDRVVFLDADIIVRFTLDELLSTPGFSAPAATIRLSGEFYSDDFLLWQELKKTYYLPGPAFNTGVFSFDTKLITATTFTEIMGLFNKFGRLNVHGEEGTLNLFFYKNWHALPMIYNSIPGHMARFYRLEGKSLRAVIIHFVNSVKPWTEISTYYSEWRCNLEKADEMNLALPLPASQLPKKEFRRYLNYLRLVDFFLASYRLLLLIDWHIGQVGLWIKYHNPRLYKLIRLRKHVIQKY